MGIINPNRLVYLLDLSSSFQAYETGKLKEAGALILKARQLLEASEPKRETTKTLHSTISSKVQSSSSSIQAALVLPATHLTRKMCSRIWAILVLNSERSNSHLR